MTHIKEIQTITIYTYIDDSMGVYIQHPNLKEMVEAPQLKDIGLLIDALFRAEQIPALQDALDRVKIVHKLSTKDNKDKVMWHPV